MPVLVFNISIGLVFHEETAQFAAVTSEDPAAAHAPIVLPLTFVEISILVVLNTSGISEIILEIAFVEFSVRHVQFDLPVDYFKAIESRLNNFIGQCVKNTVTLGFIISEFAPIHRSSLSELAKASATPLTILVGTFVDIAVRVNQLALAIPDSFNDSTLIDDILDLIKFIESILHKGSPMPGQTVQNRVFRVMARWLNVEFLDENFVLFILVLLVSLDRGLAALVMVLN